MFWQVRAIESEESAQRTRATFRNELWRALPAGVLETLVSTFAILFAVKVFDAAPTSKSLLLAGGRAGLIASFFVVPMFLYLRRPVAHLAGVIQMFAGLALLIVLLFRDSLAAYVTGTALAMFCFSLQIPLVTKIYRTNYPEKRRGKLFAATTMLRSLVAMGFTALMGHLLGAEVDRQVYFGMIATFAVCCFASGLGMFRIPSHPDLLAPLPARPTGSTESAPRQPIFHALRWVREDRLFRTLLIAWMILGIGNLIALSLFVDYFANDRFGIGYTVPQVAFLAGVVMPAFRIGSTFFWGLLFDRMNFFVLRILMNLGFASWILCVFVGSGYFWHCLGMALMGIAFGGGNLAWSLWVTKLAPNDRVAEYMSIHTFFTGLRGVATPFIAYAMVAVMSPATMAWICVALVLASCLLIVPMIPLGRLEPDQRKA